VSRDGIDFVKYSNPEWGRKPYVPGLRHLLPNQSAEGIAKIIWNEKPNVGGMNTRAAERWQRGKILTDYTFQNAGTYFVKAAVWGIVDKTGRGLARVESEPIEITIEEPEGEDLEVWRRVQNREEIAYFMQEALIKTVNGNNARRQRLINELQTIADQYPDSLLASQIRQKLREYRATYPNERFSN
jgi:hypothetical protein